MISLCLIVGNVESYISRCLESFSPIADELCVVRAVGAAPADDTLRIASTFPRVRSTEYLNKPGHQDWPHVDDFAAARQQSFDIATGDYLFWCDSDDIFEGDPQVVRDFAQRGGYPALIVPYKIFAKGLVVNRVRMMSRRSGRWVYPVHEDYRFHIEPVQAVQEDRCAVVHLPKMDGTKDSTPRNLRILESMDVAMMPTGMLYHLHTELILAKRIDESVELAKLALARPDIGKPEKYEIFLNFAEASSDDTQKEAFLNQAYLADPTRREALGLMSVVALRSGDKSRSLAYARQMMATVPPTEVAWNERTGVYGWIGQDIYGQALRASGHFDEAEKVRQAAFASVGGPLIALVHATRGRPEQAAATRKKWLELACNPERVEHIFVYDSDDPQSARLSAMHHLTIPPGGGCVAAWNHGCLATTAPVIVQLSDDWSPPQRWDKLILGRIGDVEKPVVLAVSDGLRVDDLLCMAICTRAYWRLDYFLFHPFFTGVFSDNWFTEQAHVRGLIIDGRNLLFEHHHFLATGEEPDATYRLQNDPQRYHDGKATLDYLHRGNDWSTVPGFFNYWHFYETIARRLKDGDVIAEVGVWLGRSVIFLAQLLQRQGKRVRIYAVDHFRGESNQKEHEATVRMCGGNVRGAFEDNLQRCGVADMITILDGDSAEMAGRVPDGSLAFCFIDAAHDEESVRRDILAWLPKVRGDGLLSGHDADHPPVRKAVVDLIPKHRILGNVWIKV